MPAPIAAKLMTSAMTWKCLDCIRSWIASRRLMLSSSPPTLPVSAGFSRMVIIQITAKQTARITAATRIRFVVPIAFAYWPANPAPIIPPRLDPPPMNPKTRFAWRGS